MTITPPLYWLKQLRDKQKKLQEIPLWGNAPPFPWQEFSEKMGALLEVSDFRVYPISQDFLPQEDSANPWNTQFTSLFFQLFPLTGVLSWLLPTESLELLTSFLCSGPQSRGTLDPRFQEGFYDFISLQASKLIQEMGVYQGLQIQWCEEGHLLPPPYFFLEIGIQVHQKTFTGKLLVSCEFQQHFRTHFGQRGFSFLESPLKSSVDVPVRLCLGHTLLSQLEWSTIKPGDLLLLDHCTYDPETAKGLAGLFWDETPIFSAKIKKNTLKILDYEVYHGDISTMDTQFPDHFSAEDDEFSLPEMEEDMPNDLEEEKPAPPEPVQKADAEPVTADQPSAVSLASMKDVPFRVTVELDEIKISLEKLLQLQPGNVLELSVHPEQGVFLTVQGKRVARGELVKMGDVLGVKILEVGKSNQT